MDLNSYITGFADGEGCFCVSFSFRNKMNFGIEVRPSFSISQNRRNIGIIKELRSFFGCGGIRFSRIDQNYKYEVRSLENLIKVIIPHFQKYPLRTSKTTDFNIFCQICNLMHQNLHLNCDGLKTIIELAFQMNESGKRRISKQELLKCAAR